MIDGRTVRRLSSLMLMHSLALALSLGPSLPTLSRAAAQDEESLPFAAVEPEAVGVDSRALREMSAWVRAGDHDVRSLILVRSGALVLEWYAGEVARDHCHNLFSITKSVVATLVGRAIQEGHLESVTQPIGPLLELPDDSSQAAIRVEDLLAMRSGLPVSRGSRPDGPERKLFDRLHRAADRRKAIAGLVPARAPGETFAYSNVDPQLALAVVESAAGESALDFASAQLFEPLGFRGYRWLDPDERGTLPGGYGLWLRAIDLAKLGQLHLQRGEWQGRQLLSENWVRAATGDRTGTGYGYFWWHSKRADAPGAFFALGVRGQAMLVDPQRELVFVMTSDLPPDRVGEIRERLIGFVLEAAGDAPLPDSPEAVAALRQEIQIAGQWVPPNRKVAPASRRPVKLRQE